MTRYYKQYLQRCLVTIGFLASILPIDAWAAGDVIRIAEHRAVRLEALRSLVPEIESSLGIEIRIVEYPSPALDYFTKLVTELRSGNAPDLFTVPRDQQIDDLAAAGYLADLTDAFADWEGYAQLVPLAKTLSKARFNQVPYVVPSILTVEQLYYRKDILEQYGISTEQPRNWPELLDRAREIKQKTGRYAMLFPAGLTWGTGSYTEGFRYLLAGSSDPRLLNNQGQYRLASKGIYEALDFYQSLVDEELMPIRPLLNPEPWVIPKYEMFPKGQLLMTTCGTWCLIFDWGPNSRNPIPDLENTVGTWKMPGVRGEQYVLSSLVYSWGVNAKSRYPELARQVALQLGSVESALAYAKKLGNVPARLDVVDHPEFADMGLLAAAHGTLVDAKAVQTTVGASTLMAGVARATESLLTGREDADGAQELLLKYVSNIMGESAVETASQ
ncbi:ABC transporter substrate-binding protein [Microbulbifer sp.]|uniref:ABC transporter substrate-binding protein n=1 Tax=Microbulbifer sp. TaxID=1908541 RepID=UPI003F35C57A